MARCVRTSRCQPGIILTEVRNVCLIAERAMVQILHPVLAQCFSLRVRLVQCILEHSHVFDHVVITLTTRTPSAGIRRGYDSVSVSTPRPSRHHTYKSDTISGGVVEDGGSIANACAS